MFFFGVVVKLFVFEVIVEIWSMGYDVVSIFSVNSNWYMLQVEVVQSCLKEFSVFVCWVMVCYVVGKFDGVYVVYFVQKDNSEEVIVVLFDVCNDKNLGFYIGEVGFDDMLQFFVVVIFFGVFSEGYLWC